MEKIVNRFRGKLVKMIRDASSKFDDYSISTKIRQILLHWGYELIEDNLVIKFHSIPVYKQKHLQAKVR